MKADTPSTVQTEAQKWKDADALKAEVERLRAEVKRLLKLTDECNALREAIAAKDAEIERLKADVKAEWFGKTSAKKAWEEEYVLRLAAVAERDAALAERDAALAERDAAQSVLPWFGSS